MNPRTPPERVLEGEPRVAFAELDPALRPDVAGRDAHAGGSARAGRQAAGRQDRVEQGETERGEDRGGPQVRLDPLEDRAEADELARRVQVEQLVGRASPRRRRRGSATRSEARIASAPTSAVTRRRSSASSGAWRCSEPPRWSRQTVQR